MGSSEASFNAGRPSAVPPIGIPRAAGNEETEKSQNGLLLEASEIFANSHLSSALRRPHTGLGRSIRIAVHQARILGSTQAPLVLIPGVPELKSGSKRLSGGHRELRWLAVSHFSRPLDDHHSGEIATARAINCAAGSATHHRTRSSTLRGLPGGKTTKNSPNCHGLPFCS